MEKPASDSKTSTTVELKFYRLPIRTIPTGVLSFLSAFVFATPYAIALMAKGVLLLHIAMVLIAGHTLWCLPTGKVSNFVFAKWMASIVAYGIDAYRLLMDSALEEVKDEPVKGERPKQKKE